MSKYLNHEYYSDPTAGKAIQNLERKKKRKRKTSKKSHSNVMKEIFEVCSKHGYRVVGRIVLEDKDTGEVWR